MTFVFNNYRLIFCIVSVVIFLSVFHPAHAAEKTPYTITATGSSSQEYAPDTAHVTLTIETQAATQTEVQAQNAKIAKNVLEQLSAFGVKEREIKTRSFLISPIYQQTKPESRQQPRIIGYRAFNSMSISVPVDKVGQLIDLGLKSGVTQVGNVQFTIKDNKKIQQEVVSIAVKDAMNKIEAIAGELGKRVVRIQSVTEFNTNIRSVSSDNAKMQMRSLAAAEASDESAPFISAGSVNIASAVQVIAEID
jgi:uncharacterized protein YggE